MRLDKVCRIVAAGPEVISEHQDSAQQTQALLDYFAKASEMPLVLVSHQVNFTALTGIFPQSAAGAILALPLTQPATVLASVSLDER